MLPVDNKIEFTHRANEECNVCDQQCHFNFRRETQQNRDKYHKNETLYKESEVNQYKKFAWLVERLTPDIAEDLPGGIKMKDYVKGCEVNLPDLAVFQNGVIKFVAQTRDDG